MSDTPKRIIELPLIPSLSDVPETARIMVDSATDSEDENTGAHGLEFSELTDDIYDAKKLVAQNAPSQDTKKHNLLISRTQDTSNFEIAETEKASGIYSYPKSKALTVGSRWAVSEALGLIGDSSLTCGTDNAVSGENSFGQGLGVQSTGDNQHVVGKYNVASNNYAEIVGNGTADDSRSNARTLDWNGNEVLAGKLTVGASPTNDMDVATKEYVDNNTGTGNVADVYVNGVSVLDADTIAQIKSYKEVTQAEYDALPSSKLTDGIMYCIKDSEFSAEDVPYDNTDSHAQSTDVQGALDEAFQRTMDMNRWFTDIIAENFDYTKTYTVGDYVFYYPSIGVLKLYRCIANTSGAWNSSKWEEVKLSNEVSDEVTLREELESATKVYGTPKNLPQPIATFSDGANLPMPSLKVSIEPIQEGSGDPSPSNVRPISGWTEGNVSVNSGNWWDEEWELGAIGSTTGQNNPATDRIRSKNYISVKEVEYYINSNKLSRIACYAENKDFLGVVPTYTPYENGYKFTPKDGSFFIRFEMSNQYGTTYNNDISINYPSTDTDYHAYNGHTTTISWEDEVGTVYGGTLDVVSGVLTVDRANYTFDGNETWTRISSDPAYYTEIPIITNYAKRPSSITTLSGLMAEFAKEDTYANVDNGLSADASCAIIYSNGRFVITEALYNNVSALTGKKVVFELATPTTYQLSPTAVKSILGVNNVWADCGSIKDLKYVRNLNITINDLISRVEALEG